MLAIIGICCALLAQSRTLKPINSRYTQYTGQLSLFLEIRSGSKAKITSILHNLPNKDKNGMTPSHVLHHQLKGKIEVQKQKAQFLTSDTPFLFLGAELTMNYNWNYRI
jgi:hypothetical protein